MRQTVLTLLALVSEHLVSRVIILILLRPVCFVLWGFAFGSIGLVLGRLGLRLRFTRGTSRLVAVVGRGVNHLQVLLLLLLLLLVSHLDTKIVVSKMN